MAKTLEETDIRRQDFGRAYSAIANNPIGRSIAWETMANHWDLLFERFSDGMGFGRLIAATAGSYSTEYHYKMVKSFFVQIDDLGSAAMSYKRSLESIRSNI